MLAFLLDECLVLLHNFDMYIILIMILGNSCSYLCFPKSIRYFLIYSGLKCDGRLNHITAPFPFLNFNDSKISPVRKGKKKNN